MTALTPVERSDRGERVALVAFVAYLVVAWVVLVFVIGSERWFFRDDWLFLASRDGGSLGSVFRPHDVHPAAVPVIVFRLMFQAFGLWFTPYLMMIVTMHLAVVALLRVVMRRAGVGPWVSTAAASSLALFGPGDQNIFWAFQINYVGALLLGLTQLLLADHDGGYDRRDLLGVLAGVAAVMCSGVGPLMVVSVGLATLLRRGWRAALLHTAPALGSYVAWVVVANPASYGFGRPSLGVTMDWMREGVAATVRALGHATPVIVLLTVLLVVGLGLISASMSRHDVRRRAAVPLALLVSVPLFFAVTAEGRWAFGLELVRSGRYLYVAAVLLLPGLALAGDALTRRWPWATVGVVVLLLAGVPGNVGEFNAGIFNERYFEIQRQTVLGAPRAPEAEQVPREVHLVNDAFAKDGLTIGWLLDQRDAGRLPPIDDLDPRISSRFPINLGLAQVEEPWTGGDCVTRSGPLDLSLVEGDRLGFRNSFQVVTVSGGEPTSAPVAYSAGFGRTLSVELPLDLRFLPLAPNRTFTLCGDPAVGEPRDGGP